LVSKEIFPWKILKPRRKKRKGCLPKTSNHILIHVEKCYDTNLIKIEICLSKGSFKSKVKGSYHAWKAINISHMHPVQRYQQAVSIYENSEAFWQ
jgi:hypothetical protein